MEKAMEKRYSPQTEAFYRRHILPEEEKTFPTTPGHGYRWFRSENVIPFEYYRRPTSGGSTPRIKSNDPAA